MKLKTLLLSVIFAFSALSTSAFAVSEHEASGVIEGVDASSRTLKIKHGPIKTMNMMGMTMNFKVADPSMIAGVKPGQKINFVLTQDNQGQFVIVDMETSEAHVSNE